MGAIMGEAMTPKKREENYVKPASYLQWWAL
jgi:hypothetical protein